MAVAITINITGDTSGTSADDWSGPAIWCWRCGLAGHYARHCASPWRWAQPASRLVPAAPPPPQQQHLQPPQQPQQQQQPPTPRQVGTAGPPPAPPWTGCYECNGPHLHVDCPRVRCWRCGLVGHMSFRCPGGPPAAVVPSNGGTVSALPPGITQASTSLPIGASDGQAAGSLPAGPHTLNDGLAAIATQATSNRLPTLDSGAGISSMAEGPTSDEGYP